MLNFLRLATRLCLEDLRNRFAGSILGSVWVFIWPIIQLFIYIIIFGKIMGARLGMSANVYAYGLYIAAGLLSWTCFAASLSRACRSFVDKRGIIAKVSVNLALFPAAACLGELIPFAAGFILLFLADLLTGWQPQPRWLPLLPVAIYTQTILAYGLGLFFACFAVFWRDVCEVCAIGLQMAFWFTPIVYLPSILPQWLAQILWINPMTPIAQVFQQCFVLNGEIHWFPILYSLLFAHASLAAGLLCLRHFRKDLRDAV